MADDTGTHPDEGTIHAWLDDALDASGSEAIGAHVRACAACAERVAEARGLIAGASRVVRELDDVPAAVLPTWGQVRPATATAATVAPPPRAEEEGSLWRTLRVTPARAAIAATLMLAAGITFTRGRTVLEAPTVASTAGMERAADAPRDAVLDSAVARNLAQSQPARTMEAAPGTAIPEAPAAPPSPTELAEGTGMRVAAGRAAAAMERETAAVGADRLRVGGTGATAVIGRQDAANTRDMIASAAVSAAPTAPPPAMESSADRGVQGNVAGVGAPIGSARRVVAAATCLELSSGTSGVALSGVPFPFVIEASGGEESQRSRTVQLYRAGVPVADVVATLVTERDSLRLVVRRAGSLGVVAMGPQVGGVAARIGEARTTASFAQDGSDAAGVRAKSQSRAVASAPAPAAATARSAASEPGSSSAPIAVSARPVTCQRR